MAEVVQSRRERHKAQTEREIKTTALCLMAGGGPDAISLRAIGRQMGMTASAIYGYFATRDDLITTLIQDLYVELLNAVEAARDSRPAADAGGRLLAWAEAFRSWSLANPQGFRLVYGDAIAGYQAPEGGAAPESERRACAELVALVAATWPQASARQGVVDHRWSDFAPSLRAEIPGLPPAAVALALRVWGRMYGLVALEIYGRLAGQTQDPAKLYRAEMLDLLTTLGQAHPG